VWVLPLLWKYKYGFRWRSKFDGHPQMSRPANLSPGKEPQIPILYVVGWASGADLDTITYLHNLLTYFMEHSPSWEAIRFSVSQDVPPPPFFGTQMFITEFTSTRHPSLSWARSIHYIHHTTYWQTILLLSSHLCLGLPSGLFPSGFLTESRRLKRNSPSGSCPLYYISFWVFLIH